MSLNLIELVVKWFILILPGFKEKSWAAHAQAWANLHMVQNLFNVTH